MLGTHGEPKESSEWDVVASKLEIMSLPRLVAWLVLTL
jgi:hypothetical protein